jgi:uncharacterized protein (TIGR02596 family)
LTLVEMLLVIAIVALLVALVTPAINGIASSNNLASAEQLILGEINLGRQAALTQSLPVEVRFYNFTGPAGDPAAFRAMQIYQIQADGTYTPLDKVQKLPTGIIMLDNGSNLYSTLLQSPTAAQATDPTIPGVSSYKIARFSFEPDGSTRLNITQSWHLTIAKWTGNSGTISPNFATIQVDPLNGTTRLFRPGAS